MMTSQMLGSARDGIVFLAASAWFQPTPSA
jgi:hypothetical protein